MSVVERGRGVLHFGWNSKILVFLIQVKSCFFLFLNFEYCYSILDAVQAINNIDCIMFLFNYILVNIRTNLLNKFRFLTKIVKERT
jgi:hypothetical protein